MLAALLALLVAQTPPPSSAPLPSSVLKLARPMLGAPDAVPAGLGHNKANCCKNGGGGGGPNGVPGITTVKNWVDAFTVPGFDPNGNPQSVWPYSMVGRPPEQGGTTNIHAPIVPVIVDLLDASGNVATFGGVPATFDPRGLVNPVLQSPVFQPFPYYSGFTQLQDGLFRSEFANRLPSDDHGQDCEDGWHTLVDPDVKRTEHMQIPYGYWYAIANPDGTCCAAALVDYNTFGNLLFPSTSPPDNSTVIGAAENSGAMTTKDITTFLFNNVYLYIGTLSQCCVLGYHSFDVELDKSGNPTLWYVMIYASWISNGLFLGGFEDITALSHEMNETFNDPFVGAAGSITPWVLSPSGDCQDLLEVGDPIEGLASNAVFSAQMNGRTYHPQNLVTFPWFAFESPSPALVGAYSFPDETTLTTLSPPNLTVNCVPAP